MNKKQIIIVCTFFAIIPLLLFNFFREKFVGNVPVKGLKEVNFCIYKDEDLLDGTTLYYTITSKDKVIPNEDSSINQQFMFSTFDNITDTRKFRADSHDSILYLVYGDSMYVFVIYDFKTGLGRGSDYKINDSLFSVLKNVNKDLKRF
jgi:hypothetical protein